MYCIYLFANLNYRNKEETMELMTEIWETKFYYCYSSMCMYTSNPCVVSVEEQHMD